LKNVQELNTIKIKYRFICERIKCHHGKLMLSEEANARSEFYRLSAGYKQNSAIINAGLSNYSGCLTTEPLNKRHSK
jgi:hypothetical protein